MRLLLILGLAVILSAGSFGLAYSLKGSNKKKDIQASAACKDTCVALRADGADPDTITVVKGSYVQFNSADGKSHSLSSGEGGQEHEHTGKFSSGEFKGDEGWRVMLSNEGTFYFHDHLNPKINILVVVYTPGKEHKITL